MLKKLSLALMLTISALPAMATTLGTSDCDKDKSFISTLVGKGYVVIFTSTDVVDIHVKHTILFDDKTMTMAYVSSSNEKVCLDYISDKVIIEGTINDFHDMLDNVLKQNLDHGNHKP